MGAVPIPKMPAAVPPVVIVAIVFAAAASPCTAGQPPVTVDAAPKPLVENLPASPAAQDFIRTRCDQSTAGVGEVEQSRRCYELMLPYATSINSSYYRAAIAGVTVMVCKLTAFAKEVGTTQGECIQLVNGAISEANESLSKLGLDAIGDDKVDAETPDLVDVTNWILGVSDSFDPKYEHVSGAAIAGDSCLPPLVSSFPLGHTGTILFPLRMDQVHNCPPMLEASLSKLPSSRSLSN